MYDIQTEIENSLQSLSWAHATRRRGVSQSAYRRHLNDWVCNETPIFTYRCFRGGLQNVVTSVKVT